MHRRVERLIQCLAVAASFFLGSCAARTGGPDQQHRHELGTVNFGVTCSPRAQDEFNRALALLHHMTYPQSRAAFQHVTSTDPACAMAHWGAAMTLFQPLWPTRPGPEALRRGWEAVQQAKVLPMTERERLFMATAEAFFLEPASPDYWLRIRRWEQAAEKVFVAFPDDPDAATLYALAHIATAPSNAISRVHQDKAAEILLGVYERFPDHPGAMHYIVHANDAPGRDREAPEIISRYASAAPRNPHALHMPTHIYTRVGDWNRVITGNRLAADAALEHPAGDRGEFIWDEFGHAIEYLVYGYLQKGADDQAAAQLERLRSTDRLEPSFKTAFHLASTQARYALERKAWSEAVAIVPREPSRLAWDRYPWAEAIMVYARGLGAARLRDIVGATAAAARLEILETASRTAGEDLFARNIRVLRIEMNAWLAHVEGRTQASLDLMQEAADLETSTPKAAVTPGPTLPAQELLGDLLMEQRTPARALAAYRRSLELYPNRFNSLVGAARAARAIGEDSLARGFYTELLAAAHDGARQTVVREAESFGARRRR